MTHQPCKRFAFTAAAAVLATGVSFAGIPAGASTDTTTPGPDVSPAAATSPAAAPSTPTGSGAEPTTTSIVPIEETATPTPTGTSDSDWERVVPGGGCQCSDASEYAYYIRPADPTKVVFMLEGGGACWNAQTCDAMSGIYDRDVSPDDDPATIGGIFDLVRPDNPFADWSIVFVPYCTGDVHLGNVEQQYGALTIQHKGAVNATAALDGMAERFPDATQIVVAGASAGSIATPIYAGLAGDRFPEAEITAYGDGSGGYPTETGGINTELLTTWGFENAIPPWPEVEGITIDQWDFTRLWTVAAEHDPDMRLARYDFANDNVQQAFIGLAGLPAIDLLESERANEATIEAGGTEMLSYTAPGNGHTLILSDGLYDMEVDGVRLADWLTQLINGEDPADVTCTECAADPSGTAGGSEPSAGTATGSAASGSGSAPTTSAVSAATATSGG